MHNLTKKQIKKVKEWIKALRSKEYKQGEQFLCPISYDGRRSYCCLGVACKINGLSERVLKQVPLYDQKVVTFSGQEANLPKKMVKSLGLRDHCGSFCGPYIVDDHEYDELTGMNDDGVSFCDIADFIELNLKTNEYKLFTQD